MVCSIRSRARSSIGANDPTAKFSFALLVNAYDAPRAPSLWDIATVRDDDLH
jgi:hypothetical protein